MFDVGGDGASIGEVVDSSCNSCWSILVVTVATAIPPMQYTSQLNFKVHSGTILSDTFLLYTVVLANRYWWPVYTRGWKNDTIYHTGIPNSMWYYTRYRQ
jgi:hypothetical protein